MNVIKDVLAKGSDIEATFAEIIGRDTGLCRGRGGSMHLVDSERGVLGCTQNTYDFNKLVWSLQSPKWRGARS